MRTLALTLLGVAAMGSAHAAPWTDPSNTITLDAPAGWVVEAQPADGLTYIVAASSGAECHVVGVPRASTVETPAYRMRMAAQQPLDTALWTQIAGMFPDLFPGQATIASHAVDTEPFWPIQRADFAVANSPAVHGAIQFRPGIEMWALCRTRNGQSDDTAAFESLFRSISTPNDAGWREQAEEGERGAEESARRRRDNQLGDRGPIGSSWGTNTQ